MLSDDDLALALQLQEQFSNESQPAKRPCLDVLGTPPARKRASTWSSGNKENVTGKSTSLVDPSWEYVDPTPDVHAMFMQFNKRFFWQKLDAVEVRWSPRMTKCAGVCCYQGRRGLCSIRLSLPLLKLRPRKDLVETLLHEMIHAYLFVTCNNRDRDGHGPEFHKHMYRINKEAGTNITVFHSFHAEVRSYQQHWWRCGGPCNRRPPFFGMVKRAMNRAPGPADFWWAQHQASCGGKFIKVREPPDYAKKKSGSKTAKDSKVGSPSKDLRDYFTGKGNVLKPPVADQAGKKKMLKKSVPFPKDSGQKGVPAKTGQVGSKSTPTAIVPYKDINQKSADAVKARGGFSSGMLANKGSGTLVVTAKGKAKTEKGDSSCGSSSLSDSFVPFTGKGYTLGASQKPPSEKPWLARLEKMEAATKERKKPLIPYKKPLLSPPSKRKGKHDKDNESNKRTKPARITWSEWYQAKVEAETGSRFPPLEKSAKTKKLKAPPYGPPIHSDSSSVSSISGDLCLDWDSPSEDAAAPGTSNEFRSYNSVIKLRSPSFRPPLAVGNTGAQAKHGQPTSPSSPPAGRAKAGSKSAEVSKPGHKSVPGLKKSPEKGKLLEKSKSEKKSMPGFMMPTVGRQCEKAKTGNKAKPGHKPVVGGKLELPAKSGIRGWQAPSSVRVTTSSMSESEPEDDSPTAVSPRSPEVTVPCPSCSVRVSEVLLNEHLDTCLQGVFDADEDTGVAGSAKCAMCDRLLDEAHVSASLCAECLRAIEQGTAENEKQTIVGCPVCSERVPYDDLDRHLESCVSPVCPSNEVLVISDDDLPECAKPPKEYACPCCGDLIDKDAMNTHLDECLSISYLENESDVF